MFFALYKNKTRFTAINFIEFEKSFDIIQKISINLIYFYLPSQKLTHFTCKKRVYFRLQVIEKKLFNEMYTKKFPTFFSLKH